MHQLLLPGPWSSMESGGQGRKKRVRSRLRSGKRPRTWMGPFWRNALPRQPVQLTKVRVPHVLALLARSFLVPYVAEEVKLSPEEIAAMSEEVGKAHMCSLACTH